MAFTYKILPSGRDSHQSTPYWFAAFVRFKERDTFTRHNLDISENASKSNRPNFVQLASTTSPVDEHPNVLIADQDVVSWSITSAKDQHVSNCQISLANGYTDYVRELASGDWVGFWAFDDYSDYIRVKKQVAAKGRANKFKDGFKFLGRVDSVRKIKSRNQMGLLTIQYSVTALGFSEFDSTIYYNPILAAKYEAAVSLWMMDFGQGVNSLIFGSQSKGLIGTHEILPKLTRICLGVGPSEESKGLRSDQVAPAFIKPEKLQATQNRAYMVPQTVGRWLLDPENFNTEKPVGLTYADLLKIYVGIQKYSPADSSDNNLSESDTSHSGFIPTIRSEANNTYETTLPLSGQFRSTVTPFDGKPVWSILKTYLNEPIEDLYVCLRVDPTGYVMPSLIARQTTLSTKWFARNGGYDVTSFVEVPRWEVDSSLIIQLDVGRSNAMRFNYLHLQGQDMTGGNVYGNMAINYSRNPPIIDPDDIARSGLRMYSRVLNANVFSGTNAANTGGQWQRIMADVLMGSHLKYSGSVMCKFIQEPIPEGDNFVVDGVIYQIERVVHSGSVSQFGIKDAITTLQLSNGIALENEDSTDFDEIIYPDMTEATDDSAGTIAKE